MAKKEADAVRECFSLSKYAAVSRERGIIVWLCNIGAEQQWYPVKRTVTDPVEDEVVGHIEEIMLLVSRPQDIVLLRQEPDRDYLTMLRDWGFAMPTILCPQVQDPSRPLTELILEDEQLLERLKEEAAGCEDLWFVPYAVTVLEEGLAEACGFAIVGASAKVSQMVNDKLHSRTLAQELGFPVTEGKVCRDEEEIRSAYEELTKAGFDKVIVKAPHGASGQGLHLVNGRSKLERLLILLFQRGGERSESVWLVEGWHDKLVDVNMQLFITEEGSVELFSLKEQLLAGTVYKGSRMGLEREALFSSALATLRDHAERSGKALYALGYRGVAGIDALITQREIYPIIEINGRFTLSTYLSFLSSVLGQCDIVSFYYRVVADTPWHYGGLCAELRREGLLYASDRGCGTLIYSAGTLPHRASRTGAYIGRVFALFVGKDSEETEYFRERFEQFLLAARSGKSGATGRKA
ncbi:ATP-grasp domain-containing protein [Paenibacillus sp. HB172176]|uniref:preATP grasp domain-containing protein n=1 Tax=Paenibacillus sp. HB172176 TaxID=2493690 RepID=UPI00143BA324|nr:ATP-grasp domain-containing protein [Paenibacillus sp. HB172176]